MPKVAETARTVRANEKRMAIVTIRAAEVLPNPDGTFDIHIEAQDISEQAREMLADLFPNTSQLIQRALDSELLLRSIR